MKRYFPNDFVSWLVLTVFILVAVFCVVVG
jgi:hypothetical protein